MICAGYAVLSDRLFSYEIIRDFQSYPTKKLSECLGVSAGCQSWQSVMEDLLVKRSG